MGYEIISRDGDGVVVRFTAGAGEVNALFGKVRARINKELQIPGFRPGHIPRSMLEQRFGNLIRTEVAESLRESLAASMLDEQDWVLSGKDQSGGDALPAENEDYVFEQKFTLFELEAPEGYDGLALTLPAFDADEAVERTLESIQWRLVDYQKVDRASRDKDLVLVQAGRPSEGREPEKMALRIGMEDLGAGLDDLLKDRVPGDGFTARIEFDKPVEGAENGKPTDFEVIEVREPVLPALDDELARKAGRFQTMDEFRASIRERAEARWKVDRREALETQALDILLSRVDFEPPAYMVDNLAGDFARNLEGERDENTDKALREISERKVKEFLVLRAIGMKESLGPSPEELDRETANGGSRSSVIDRIRNRMTLEHILSKATVEERKEQPSTTASAGGQGWSWRICAPAVPAAD
ncbi:MAG TPA: trigger factor [Candidatus Fermentibacter daniensis]|nr:trigger factor [Candidatus Fermentibacter daniensis]HOR07656.1 trigger factor [Candidatus Fermentibacter daniensis]HPK52059.1 trigger factor [Candidatus Fermentibacter daniensis]